MPINWVCFYISSHYNTIIKKATVMMKTLKKASVFLLFGLGLGLSYSATAYPISVWCEGMAPICEENPKASGCLAYFRQCP